ncbi:MAG: hypothetical protein KA199_05775, partial [Sphingorhabdus sp.]|nr:hypothetical protein [Sphingorhabdus sp.]
MPDLEQLSTLIEPEAKALGFDLVRVAWIKGDEPTLQIMAERPETRQLNIDDCAALSHRISDKFDELDPIEEAYRLEVSSPGIDRPLTRPADYVRFAGHLAKRCLRVAQGLRAGLAAQLVALGEHHQQLHLAAVHPRLHELQQLQVQLGQAVPRVHQLHHRRQVAPLGQVVGHHLLPAQLGV